MDVNGVNPAGRCSGKLFLLGCSMNTAVQDLLSSC